MLGRLRKRAVVEYLQEKRALTIAQYPPVIGDVGEIRDIIELIVCRAVVELRSLVG